MKKEKKAKKEMVRVSKEALWVMKSFAMSLQSSSTIWASSLPLTIFSASVWFRSSLSLVDPSIFCILFLYTIIKLIPSSYKEEIEIKLLIAFLYCFRTAKIFYKWCIDNKYGLCNYLVGFILRLDVFVIGLCMLVYKYESF